MTAQSSKNRFLQYYISRLGRLKYLIILLFVFGFMTFPLYSIFLEGYVSETLNDKEPYTSGTYQALCNDLGWKLFVVGVLGGLVVMLIIGLEGFRYLHKKDYVNIDLSLPVTHTQRFFGDLLAVLTAQFVPIFAVCGIGAAVAAHVRSFDYSYMYPNGGTPQYLYYCGQLERIIPQFIIAAIMLVAMSLFVISFCGRTPIAVIMTILVQAAVPVTTFCLWVIALSGAYGANDNSLMNTSIMSLLSPVGFLFAFGMGPHHQLLNSSPWGYIFIAIYVTALIVGSYFVQKHRLSERTGDPFVFKYARHAFTALFELAVITFFGMRIFAPEYVQYTNFYSIFGGGTTEKYDLPFVFICIGAAMVVFVIMEIIGGGSIKKFPISAARFVVTAGVCFGICAVIPATGCFGYTTHIPSAAVADNARLSINYHWDNMQCYVPYEDAAELHKRILAEHPGSGLGLRGPINVSIEYFNGDNYVDVRTYDLNESYAETLYDLYFRYGGFSMQYQYQKPEDQSRTERGDDGRWVTYTLERTKDFAYIWTSSQGPNITDEEEQEKYMVKSDVDTDELYDAIIEDAKSATFEQVYRSEYLHPRNIYIRRIYSYRPDENGIRAANICDYDYRIYPFYTRTLALLKTHGIDLFPDTAQDWSGYSAFLIKASTDENSGSVENVSSLYSDWAAMRDGYLEGKMRRLTDEPELLNELMSYTAEKTSYQGDERYYIWLSYLYYGQDVGNGNLYPITEAHTARAAEIYASLPVAQEELDNLRDHGDILPVDAADEYEQAAVEQ